MSDKTIEQLEAEAAEAMKTIQALEDKRNELAEQKRKAERELAEQKRKAEELAGHRAAALKTLETLSLVGPPLRKLAGELEVSYPALKWEVVSAWDKYEHGEENRAAIETAERANPIQLSAKLGGRVIRLLASPKVNRAGRLSSRTMYKVVGAVQLTIEDCRVYNRPKQVIYKRWEGTAEKMVKIISNAVSADNAEDAKAKERKDTLDTILFLAKAQFPKAEVVEVAYMYRPDTLKRHGFVETNRVRLIIQEKKSNYNTRRQFENVLAIDGKLTYVTMIRVPVK